jgi:hypothetical protein
MESKGTPPPKFSVNFGQGTTIGTQHIGDVINSKVENTSTIGGVKNINVQQLESSLKDFVDKVSMEAQQEENIPAEEAKTFQTKVNELARTTKDLNNGVNQEKKRTIRDRLKSVAVSLVKMSPKIARTIIGFTPLAPFSNLIGESFDNMVKAALDGKPQ